MSELKEFWIMSPTERGRPQKGVGSRRKVMGFIPDSPKHLLKECDYRDALAVKVGGITEVQMAIGRADVMTPEMVFEVKALAEWKRGVMQVLAYSAESGLPPSIAVFDGGADAPSEEAWRVCKAVGVSIWWHGPKGWRRHYKNPKSEATALLIRELQRTQQPLTPDELAAGGPAVVCIPRPHPSLQFGQAWSPAANRPQLATEDRIS